MLRVIASGIVLGLIGAGAVAGVLQVWPIGNPTGEIAVQGDVARGAYLARASGCIACHTNVEAGGPALAGGAPLKTDFGTFYPPNLTTHPTSGMGNWSAQEFARAVRQGISPEGDPYYPTFPYPFYGSFSDQDIADLWAAFQTVPPVEQSAQEHEVSFPFDQRWGLKLWRWAFLKSPLTDPDPSRGEDWNRGQELVNGAAHCGACHTARNFAGARISEARFKGSSGLPGGGKSPSIRAETLTKRGWNKDNLAYALKSGITPTGDSFGASMGEVVQQGTRFLTDADRRAIARYLMEPAPSDETASAQP